LDSSYTTKDRRHYSLALLVPMEKALTAKIVAIHFAFVKANYFL